MNFLDEYKQLLSKYNIGEEEGLSLVKSTIKTKRALLIGINYFGQEGELYGCHNDIDNLASHLLSCGFSYFVSLKDSKEGITDVTPTRANITKYLKKLIKKTGPGDTLYIHYSGHGSYVRDLSGDEVDLRDECICPYDYAENGFIIDDELNEIIKSAPADAKLRICFDSCHSGSVLDLPFRWISSDRFVNENNAGDGRDIIFISGCMDSQTSADAYIKGNYSGAMTRMLLDALYDIKKSMNTTFTWVDLINMMRYKLHIGGYQQIPQLSLDSSDFAYNRIDLI